MSSTTYLVLSLLIFVCILGIICKLTLLQRNLKTTKENFQNDADYEFQYFTDEAMNADSRYEPKPGENLNWNNGMAPDTACYKEEEPDKIYRKQVKTSRTELGPKEIEDSVPLPRPRCCTANDFEMQYDDSLDDTRWNNNKFCGTKYRNRVKKDSSADCVGGDPNALSSDQKQKTNGTCCDDQRTYSSKYYSSLDDANKKQNRYDAPGQVPGYNSVPCETTFSYYSQDEKECTDENSGESVIRVRGDGPVEQNNNNNTPCSVDCVVSGWSGWTGCSASCGGGTQMTNPIITTYAVGNGNPCPAPKTQPCNTHACPADCQVSGWVNDGICSKDCGGGKQQQIRTVTQEKIGAGAGCPPLTQVVDCNTQPCPVDCVTSPWSSLGSCDKSCGGGTQTRTKTLVTAPKNGGKPCGQMEDSRNCNQHACKEFVQISTKKKLDWGFQHSIYESHDSMYSGRLAARNRGVGTVFHFQTVHTSSCDFDIGNAKCVRIRSFRHTGGVPITDSNRAIEIVKIVTQAGSVHLRSDYVHHGYQGDQVTLYNVGGNEYMFLTLYEGCAYALKVFDDKPTHKNIQFDKIKNVQDARQDESYIFLVNPASSASVDKVVKQSFRQEQLSQGTSPKAGLVNLVDICNKPNLGIYTIEYKTTNAEEDDKEYEQVNDYENLILESKDTSVDRWTQNAIFSKKGTVNYLKTNQLPTHNSAPERTSYKTFGPQRPQYGVDFFHYDDNDDDNVYIMHPVKGSNTSLKYPLSVVVYAYENAPRYAGGGKKILWKLRRSSGILREYVVLNRSEIVNFLMGHDEWQEGRQTAYPITDIPEFYIKNGKFVEVTFETCLRLLTPRIKTVLQQRFNDDKFKFKLRKIS